jgi:hypothetical protein
MNNSPVGRQQISTHTRRLHSRLRQWWIAYWQNKARRAAVVMLPMLDNRMLQDMRLTRSDVRAIVLSGEADRVRLHAAGWSDVERSDAAKPQYTEAGTIAASR